MQSGCRLGGTNDPPEAEWRLLALFPREDIVAFTTRPGLVHRSTSDIPENDDGKIASHTKTSVGFAEAGWRSRVRRGRMGQRRDGTL